MTTAFQVILLIIIFCSAVMAMTEKDSNEIKQSSIAINIASLIAFCVSVVWL